MSHKLIYERGGVIFLQTIDPLQLLITAPGICAMTTEYVLDGAKVTSLEAFFDEISDTLIPGARWGRNLDAFDDVLRGGFGTPEGGVTLRWVNSGLSRKYLGYPETVRHLEIRLRCCDPANRDRVRRDLNEARQGRGATAFDWLLEIIRDHGPNGSEAEDNIHLVLD